jgi:glycosyltransferase involved in cell wall biosynthesis
VSRADISSLPRAAVIVAVYNARATLRACLESLVHLDYPSELLEIVCVNNASTDDSLAILTAYGEQLRILHEDVRGPAAARNRGLRHTTADVVAFTDADCIVDGCWLRNLLHPLRDAGVGVVGGRILSRPSRNPIERFGERVHDHAHALRVCNPPYAITMNWASRASVLESIGRFDERWLRSSDVDCAYRMLAAGYRLVYEPTAVIYHHNERTPWGLFHEGYLHGFHGARVNALHAALIARVRPPAGAARRSASQMRPRQHWSDALWWSLFNLGKRTGQRRAAHR